MRTSCNGCRVLRKGCSDDCIIRPCLQWIKSPEAQANATVFLAKFYGRAGLLNLLNAGPDHLRPALFQSLLYESCGRVVEPVCGSVGLLCSGQWQHCQVAVDAVFKGLPIMQLPNTSPHQMIKLYDIRHMSPSITTMKESGPLVMPEFQHPRVPTRPRFQRPRPRIGPGPVPDSDHIMSSNGGAGDEIEVDRNGHSGGSASMFDYDDTAVEAGTVAAGDHMSQKMEGQTGESSEMGLELTLGFNYYDKYGPRN